jgi:hypothetical protein
MTPWVPVSSAGEHAAPSSGSVKIALRILGLLCLVAGALGAYNFFTLGPAAEPAARAAACQGRPGRCAPAMTRLERTAFYQDARFRVGADTVTVRCARAAYLLGELRCAVR